ncbi:MAG: hypothetical protein V2G41_10085 [bacterium JZ-2024 1]
MPPISSAGPIGSGGGNTVFRLATLVSLINLNRRLATPPALATPLAALLL